MGIHVIQQTRYGVSDLVEKVRKDECEANEVAAPVVSARAFSEKI
jgi:hypothetical protein